MEYMMDGRYEYNFRPKWDIKKDKIAIVEMEC